MNKPLSVIIVEDEELARNLLKEYLKDFPEITLAGEYEDGFSGARAINKLKPGLVFLDIQMPKLTGFELLEILDYKPRIIFTTAYDQYAIRAFEINAVDYLLKPFSRTRFGTAVKKAIASIDSGKDELEKLISYSGEAPPGLERIVVRSGKKIHVIPCQDIHYLEAQDDYVMIHSAGGKYLKQKTMKYFDLNLERDRFIRVHRSYIINVDQIVRLELYEKESYRINLKHGTTIPVSKSGLKNLKTRLDF